jgi:flagella basal body P-ring formation protein FlgA
MKLHLLTAAALFAFAASASAQAVKVPLGAPPVLPAANFAADDSDQVRLNPSVSVTGDVIRLGDLFSGYIARPDKVVANAPAPGQRTTLSAEWLENISRTYGLGWRPASAYDRITVYQPGQTVTAQTMIGALRTEFLANGMPEGYDLIPAAAIGSVTVSAAGGADIRVRDAFFDPARKIFSAVLEIPANDPKATYIPVRGTTYATAVVPMLKESLARNQIITADMIEMVKVRAEQVKPATVTDPNVLVGKSPKFLVKAHLPVLDTDIAQIRMVDVPVLRMVATRDDKITRDQIEIVAFNSADLPPNIVMDAAQLLGKNPRRTLPAGAPINANDLVIVRHVTVPVLTHNIDRGVVLTAADLTTATITEAELTNNVLVADRDIIGRAAQQPLRAGQLIHGFNIARPIAIERGAAVTIVYAVPMMNLTAQGVTQQAGSVGDSIRVSNSKSNATVIAEVIDGRTVRIGPRQNANVAAASGQ